MKLLFVLENYLPHLGGVEIVFKNLCESLAQQGHDVRVVTHRMKNAASSEIINGVKIHRVSCFGSRYLFTFFSIPGVLKLARGADIIHTTTFNGAPPAWLAARLLHKPVAITVHEVWIGKWKQLTEMGAVQAAMHDLLERLIYLLPFDCYACVSHSTKRQLDAVGIHPTRSLVIHNGVDYDFWNPRKYDGRNVRKELNMQKNFIYLFYGRPGISKGLEYLIRAVPLISAQVPNAKLLAIVSKDNAYKKQYLRVVKLIEMLHLKDRIILHGPLPYKELPSFIKAADCVVVPSLAEGFGFAAAESCAMGRPVVASDTTSLPEVVSGKFVLVPPKDPRAIADAVVQVKKGKCRRTQLRKFLWKDAVERYLKVYHGLLEKR